MVKGLTESARTGLSNGRDSTSDERIIEVLNVGYKVEFREMASGLRNSQAVRAIVYC